MSFEKTLIVLAGLPGSGKSTSITQLLEGENEKDWFTYSTDAYIELEAAAKDKTYSDVFDDTYKVALKYMNEAVDEAIKDGKNVIWDQTNMGAKKRKGIVNRFPKDYSKICIVIVPPSSDEQEAELMTRLHSRKGKDVPDSVIEKMIENYEEPTLDEGFSAVYMFNIYGQLLGYKMPS